MTEVNMGHMDYLEAVAREDVHHLQEKERTYQGSWKRRGGVGAFMMLARKWDRLEPMVARRSWNIFAAISENSSGDDGSVLAEIRDLRRYLLLVEAEMISEGQVPLPVDERGGYDVYQELASRLGVTRQEAKQKAIEAAYHLITAPQHVIDAEVEGMLPQENRVGADEVDLDVPPWRMSTASLERVMGGWPKAMDALFQKTTLHLRVLEPAFSVPDEYTVILAAAECEGKAKQFVQDVLRLYDRSSTAVPYFVLNVAAAPLALRSYWPTLAYELNAKEHSEVPAWQRQLYDWKENETKFRIRDEDIMWTKSAGEM